MAAVVSLAALCFPGCIPASAQQLAQRLILKDGSYQLVTKYEVRAERVRYFSAERGEWEDVPESMVDWAATQKWEKERASGIASPEAAELDKELEAERRAEQEKTPEVAPGLRLPEEGGVFLLDDLQNQPQLEEIEQSGGQVNKNMKRNILRATINPVASAKQTIELPGEHAKIQAHIGRPTFFIGLDQGQDVSPEQPQKTAYADKPTDPMRFKIVRCQSKPNKRIVGAIKIAVYGKMSQQENLVPSKSEVMPGGAWVKVMPITPLTPGEYAIVEMLADEGMNLYVWDFGMNPSAPPNPGSWRPNSSVRNKSGSR